jgi:hypothetical protein
MNPKIWLLTRAVLTLVLMASGYALAIGAALGLLTVAYTQAVDLHVHVLTLIAFGSLLTVRIRSAGTTGRNPLAARARS